MSGSTKTSEAPVLAERLGHALVITINRPEAGNSVSLEVAEEIERVLRSHETSPGLWAAVLTGAGERFFCTGGDLKAYRSLHTRAQLARAFGRVRKMLDGVEAFSLPVIAAINGYAVGGGADLALACDLRIASASARIGFLHTRVGLISGWDGVQRLVEALGRSTAMKLMLTGEKLSAADAHEIGLVDIVSESSAIDAALRFTEQLRDAAPLTLRATKKAVLAATRKSPAEARRVSAKVFEGLWFSADHREAERAFVEKRPPLFRGK
jgi:(E)-benzylidenesuccinyl-CoA hydratase